MSKKLIHIPSSVNFNFHDHDRAEARIGNGFMYTIKIDLLYPGRWEVCLIDKHGRQLYSIQLNQRPTSFIIRSRLTLLSGTALYTWRLNDLGESSTATRETAKAEAKASPKDKNLGKYILWCPESSRPPRVVVETAEKAEQIAAEMAERHGGRFYWALLSGITEKKKKVVTTYETVTQKL